MGMQVPTTWQGIPGQPQIPTTPQQMATPGAALQQPGLVFPIQQYQVSCFISSTTRGMFHYRKPYICIV